MCQKLGIENRLAQIRKSRGIGAADLARRVNVSRQTIYAIEAGTYVLNTEVALHLAQDLVVTVDELVLTRCSSPPRCPESVSTTCSATHHSLGTSCSYLPGSARVGSAFLYRTPRSSCQRPNVIVAEQRNKGRAELMVFAKEEALTKEVAFAGSDRHQPCVQHGRTYQRH